MAHSTYQKEKTDEVVHSQVSQCSYTSLIPGHHFGFVCDMARSYVTWLIRMWHDTFMWHGSVCPLCMLPDSFVCDMTHPYVTWLVLVAGRYGISWVYVASGNASVPDLFVRDRTTSDVTWLLRMWHHSFIRHTWRSDMEWLQLVGSLKS